MALHVAQMDEQRVREGVATGKAGKGGEALEPVAMRRAIAARARALLGELGLSARRRRTVEPA